MSRDSDIVLFADCYRVEGRNFNEMNMPAAAKVCNMEARKLAEEAVRQNAMDIHDSQMSRILTGLGNTLSQLQEFDEALALQQEAMRLCRDVSREQSDASTIVQLNLGFLLLRRGDLEGAESLLRATVEEDPQAAYAWYPLGNTYVARGKVNEALAAHLTTLKIYTSWFGEYQVLVADSMYKTGEILLLNKEDAEQAR
jgi:tetratricopeptide (TPR) repeat protein